MEPAHLLKSLVMRALVCLLVFLSVTEICLAQVQYRQGTVYVDGASSLTLSNNKYLQPENTWSDPPRPEFNGLAIASGPVGVFAFDRLLVGAYASYSYGWYGDNFLDGSVGNYENYRVNPFVRYYLLAGDTRKWNLFAELGFGTFGGGDLPSFETDFHLGAGIDVPLLPGVVGTARLAYNANASGLNFTTLNVGGNLLLGQFGALTYAPLAKGSWTTRGQLASASFGHMRRDGNDWYSFNYTFRPSVGYFLADGLLLAANISFSYDITRNAIQPTSGANLDGNFKTHDFASELEARYYPYRTGKWLPFGAVALGYDYRETVTFSADRITMDPIHGTQWRVAAGMNYFLGQHVALELAVSYQREYSRTTINDFTFPAEQHRNIALQTGFALYFGR